MTIPSVAMKWGARLAWMRTQLAKEQAFLEEARMPAKRLDFARSQLGKDYLSRSQQDSHALVARVQKVVKVREHYLAKHAGQDIPGSTDVLKPTGAWGAQLQTARAELEGQTETLVRDVVRRSLLGAFREGRKSPFDAAVEVSAADKALRDEALPLAKKLLIDPSVKTPWITRESGPEHQGVDRIADAIQGVAPASPAPRRLVVFQDDRLTAFSAGANRMGVSEGLRTRLSDDPAAMAFVIGHETAHDRGRDIAGTIALHSRVASVRRVAQQARLNAPQLSLEIERAMKDLPEKIHLMKEAQADANGVRWAAQAGYDPKGSLRAMAALKVPGRSEAAYASAGYWSPEKRIQWLRHLIAAEKLEHTHVTP